MTAQAKKLNHDSHLVYVLTGDGELQEGQNWEAIMYAAAKGVDNIIATVDFNGQQIDGSTKDVLSLGNLKAKFEAFDWEVVEIEQGNRSFFSSAIAPCFDSIALNIPIPQRTFLSQFI